MARIIISAVALAAAALLLLMPLLSAGGGAAAADPSPAPIGIPNCLTSCGGLEVPYPFGIGPDASCYLPGLSLICDNNTGSSSRLLLDSDDTIQVLEIRNFGYMNVQRNGDVKIDVDAHGNGNGTFTQGLRHDGSYMLLTRKYINLRSELILTGCNVQVTVKSGNVTVASCTSLCDDTADYEISVIDRCSGGSTGCCRANIIMPGYDDDGRGEVYSSSSTAYDVQLRRLGRWNRSSDRERFPVRVFIAKHGWFDNTSVSNDLLQTGRPPSKETMAVPVWLKWEVVGHPSSSSVCKSNHSERTNGTRRGGYTCACKEGYQDNPYLTDGWIYASTRKDPSCVGARQEPLATSPYPVGASTLLSLWKVRQQFFFSFFFFAKTSTSS